MHAHDPSESEDLAFPTLDTDEKLAKITSRYIVPRKLFKLGPTEA